MIVKNLKRIIPLCLGIGLFSQATVAQEFVQEIELLNNVGQPKQVSAVGALVAIPNDGGFVFSVGNSVGKLDNQGVLQWFNTYDGFNLSGTAYYNNNNNHIAIDPTNNNIVVVGAGQLTGLTDPMFSAYQAGYLVLSPSGAILHRQMLTGWYSSTYNATTGSYDNLVGTASATAVVYDPTENDFVISGQGKFIPEVDPLNDPNYVCPGEGLPEDYIPGGDPDDPDKWLAGAPLRFVMRIRGNNGGGLDYQRKWVKFSKTWLVKNGAVNPFSAVDDGYNNLTMYNGLSFVGGRNYETSIVFPVDAGGAFPNQGIEEQNGFSYGINVHPVGLTTVSDGIVCIEEGDKNRAFKYDGTNVVWEVVIPDNLLLKDIATTKSGHVVVLARDNENNHPVLIKMSANSGHIFWRMDYENYGEPHALTSISNGGFAFLTEYSDGTWPNTLLVVRTNAQGKTCEYEKSTPEEIQESLPRITSKGHGYSICTMEEFDVVESEDANDSEVCCANLSIAWLTDVIYSCDETYILNEGEVAFGITVIEWDDGSTDYEREVTLEEGYNFFTLKYYNANGCIEERSWIVYYYNPNQTHLIVEGPYCIGEPIVLPGLDGNLQSVSYEYLNGTPIPNNTLPPHGMLGTYTIKKTVINEYGCEQEFTVTYNIIDCCEFEASFDAVQDDENCNVYEFLPMINYAAPYKYRFTINGHVIDQGTYPISNPHIYDLSQTPIAPVTGGFYTVCLELWAEDLETGQPCGYVMYCEQVELCDVPESGYQTPQGTGYNSNNQQVAIAPNPSSGYYNLSKLPVGQQIKVYGTSGEIILQDFIQETEYILDLTHMSPGIYILEIKGLEDQSGEYHKLIKQ